MTIPEKDNDEEKGKLPYSKKRKFFFMAPL